MSENDGSFVIDTAEGMAYFRALQMKYALKIEVATGMKHSKGSVLNLVNRTYGQNFRLKKQALAFMTAEADRMKAEAETAKAARVQQSDAQRYMA
jgi:hypothetical protein